MSDADAMTWDEWVSGHVGHRVQTWTSGHGRVTSCLRCEQPVPSDAEVIRTQVLTPDFIEREIVEESSRPYDDMSLEEECDLHGHTYYAEESSLPGSGRCYCGAVCYPPIAQERQRPGIVPSRL